MVKYKLKGNFLIELLFSLFCYTLIIITGIAYIIGKAYLDEAEYRFHQP